MSTLTLLVTVTGITLVVLLIVLAVIFFAVVLPPARKQMAEGRAAAEANDSAERPEHGDRSGG